MGFLDHPPVPNLPYVPSYLEWIEHTKGCPPCFVAHGVAGVGPVNGDALCSVGLELAEAVDEAIHEQHHMAMQN